MGPAASVQVHRGWLSGQMFPEHMKLRSQSLLLIQTGEIRKIQAVDESRRDFKDHGEGRKKGSEGFGMLTCPRYSIRCFA